MNESIVYDKESFLQRKEIFESSRQYIRSIRLIFSHFSSHCCIDHLEGVKVRLVVRAEYMQEARACVN